MGAALCGIYTIHCYANIENYSNEVQQQYADDRNNIRDYDGVPDYDTNVEFYQIVDGQGLSLEEYTLIKNHVVTMDFSMDIKEIVKEMQQFNVARKGYMDMKL